MNAQEAFAKTVAATNSSVSVLRNEVDKTIESAASQGKRSIYYFCSRGPLSKMQEQALFHSLEADGFTLRHVADPDPGHPCSRPYTEISW